MINWFSVKVIAAATTALIYYIFYGKLNLMYLCSSYSIASYTSSIISNILARHSVLTDYRKNALNLIFGPYLMNIKKLSYDDAFNIIEQLVNRCDSIKKLDSNFNYRIKYVLENLKEWLFVDAVRNAKRKE
jgi:hypothetical protein